MNDLFCTLLTRPIMKLGTADILLPLHFLSVVNLSGEFMYLIFLLPFLQDGGVRLISAVSGTLLTIIYPMPSYQVSDTCYLSPK